MNWMEEIAAFVPANQAEAEAHRQILAYAARMGSDALLRDNLAHLTASAMVLDPAGEHVLMVYHNIYQSWAWTGGHADGDENLLAVALREAEEETGVTSLEPLSLLPQRLDILPVPAHQKRGRPVCPHLHLSVAYCAQAPLGALQAKPDENSAAAWLPIAQLAQQVSEQDMLPVYRGLIEKGRALQRGR